MHTFGEGSSSADSLNEVAVYVWDAVPAWSPFWADKVASKYNRVDKTSRGEATDAYEQGGYGPP